MDGQSVAFLVLLIVFLVKVQGEIRCYCNEAGCVTTGYMCKSQLGMCYSLVKYKEGTLESKQTFVHGCADTLQREPRIRTCAGQGIEANDAELKENATDVHGDGNAIEVVETVLIQDAGSSLDVNSNNVDPTEPVLMCCTQDMCNYKDSMEISVIIDTNTQLVNEGVTSRRTNDGQKPQKDLWFKAAVIAVPIAGGFILILLVLLAVRMLRTDSRQHRRLIQIRRERSLTKAQLYVTDHFIDKDKKPPCDNHSHVHHSQQHSQPTHNSVHSQPPSTGHSSSRDTKGSGHSHRHSNGHHHHHHHHHHHSKRGHPKVTTSKNGHTYEQIVSPNSDGSVSNPDQTCAVNNNNNNSLNSANNRTSPFPSVIVWGQPKTDIAAVV